MGKQLFIAFALSKKLNLRVAKLAHFFLATIL